MPQGLDTLFGAPEARFPSSHTTLEIGPFTFFHLWTRGGCNDSEPHWKYAGWSCAGALPSLRSTEGQKKTKLLRTSLTGRGAAHSKDLLMRRITGERGLLRNVEAALQRIRDGSFGECALCEKEINAKRLEAVPWTRYCTACQERVERRL